MFPEISVTVETSHHNIKLGLVSAVDISAYVHSGAIKRGRDDAFGSVGVGQCSLVLNNADRRFSPSYEAGAYASWLDLGRQIRIGGTIEVGEIGPVLFYLFRGVITDIRGLDSDVAQITASDVMYAFGERATLNFSGEEPIDYGDLFGSATLTGNVASDVFLETMFDDTGWTGWNQDLDAGDSDIACDEDATHTYAEWIRMVEQAENGLFFAAADGDLTWRRRNHRNAAPYTTVQCTLEAPPTGSNIGYVKLDDRFDASRTINRAVYTREGGSFALPYENAAAITKYGTRQISASGVLLPTDAETLQAAAWVVARGHKPGHQIRGVTIKNGQDAAWEHMLGREISDLIRIKYAPYVNGTTGRDFHIEGVEHRWGPGHQWETKWRVSPALAQPGILFGVQDRDIFGHMFFGY